VGDTVINLSTVSDIVMKTNGNVHVHFIGPVDDDLIPANIIMLVDQEAEALRRWLMNLDNVEYCDSSGGRW
jgi:hypothetical protein